MNKPNSISWNRTAVEGIAIVASILLAFAIDAWWSERRAAQFAEDSIDSLIGEFSANQEALAAAVETNSLHIESVARLIALDSGRWAGSEDSALEFIVRVTSADIPNLSVGETTSVIAGGALSGAKYRELSRLLQNWLALVEDLNDGAPNAQIAFRDFYEVSKRNKTLTALAALRDGIGETELSATALLERYAHDDATKQSLADVAIQVSWMLEDIRTMETAAADILAELHELRPPQ